MRACSSDMQQAAAQRMTRLMTPWDSSLTWTLVASCGASNFVPVRQVPGSASLIEAVLGHLFLGACMW